MEQLTFFKAKIFADPQPISLKLATVRVNDPTHKGMGLVTKHKLCPKHTAG
jgi:hypothetical protein